jgi:hypothetical protein
MNYLVYATLVHPSLCLQYLILLFTIDIVTVFILLLLLLFYYCHYYKIVATDKLLRASLFPGAAELATHLLKLINILWLPLCRINKFGFYFPRRLLRSPILVVHHPPAPRLHHMQTRVLCGVVQPNLWLKDYTWRHRRHRHLPCPLRQGLHFAT